MEADASRYHGVAGNEPIDWSDPAINTRAVREYLATLDPAPDKSRTTPKVVSLSDPCSAWTAKANKRVLFGYGLNYLIDNDTPSSLMSRQPPPGPMTRWLQRRP